MALTATTTRSRFFTLVFGNMAEMDKGLTILFLQKILFKVYLMIFKFLLFDRYV